MLEESEIVHNRKLHTGSQSQQGKSMQLQGSCVMLKNMVQHTHNDGRLRVAGSGGVPVVERFSNRNLCACSQSLW